MTLKSILKSTLLMAAASATILNADDASAVPAYKFDLAPNDTINDTCEEKGATETSKIKVRIKSISQTVTWLELKIKLCTKKYGFRTAIIGLHVPTELVDNRTLKTLLQGQTSNFTNVPRFVDPTVKAKPGEPTSDSIQLERLTDTNGWAILRLSWLPDANGAVLFPPLVVFLAKSDSDLGSVPGFQPGTSLRWKGINAAYKHPMLSKPFIMNGQLSEITEE